MDSTTIPNTTDRAYDDALIVLQCMYASADQLAKLAPTCEEYRYFREWPPFQVAFEAIWGFFQEFKELPTSAMLERDLKAIGKAHNLAEIFVNTLLAQATVWLGRKIVNLGPAEAILRAYREDSIRERLRTQLETDHLPQVIATASQEIKADPFFRPTEENPFNNPAFYMEVSRPFPFGPAFLDLAMDGGALVGETIGLIAPSGGGKTTVGFQVSERQVFEHRHVVYLATEQKMKGDLALRTFVLATDMGRSDWKGNWANISPRARERWEKARDPWLKYFHFYDLSKMPLSSVDDLYAPVREQIAKDQQPVFVIIDWWGDVRDALTAGLDGQRVSEPDIRRRARGWLKEVVNKASEYGVINLLLHQLKGASASKSASHINSSHDAQEDSNFNNRMDFAFALSRKDANGNVACSVDKARRFRNTVLKLKLDGEHCRFHLQEDPDGSANELRDNVCDNDADNNYGTGPRKEDSSC